MLLAICGRTPVASLPKRSPSFDCCREGIRTASYLSISHALLRITFAGDVKHSVVPLNGAKIGESLSSNPNFKLALNYLCLQGVQKRDLLKPAPQAAKSRLQIFFQLFSLF